MQDNQQAIDTLNELLRGELMAMNIYRETDDMQGDEQVMAMLDEFAKDHEEHARLLAERIRELGGTPLDSADLAGLMVDMSAKVNALMGPSHLLEQIYEGERKGVHAYKDRLDELDPKSQELVKRIMHTDYDHLERFSQRIGSEEKEN